MQFINKRVLLHKSPSNPSFEVLELTREVIRDDLSFIYMRNVSFVICEKNKDLYKETNQYTDHAWAEGILIDAFPAHLKLTKNQLKLIDTGIPVSYNRDKNSSFVVSHSGTPIETAKELIGYKGKLKVFL